VRALSLRRFSGPQMPFLPAVDPDRLFDYAIFSDESCITGHRYMLVGGVSCATRDAERVNAGVAMIRRRSRFPGDSLQWKNIKGESKLRDYRSLVDYFCGLNEDHVLDFTCVVIDTHMLDHRRFNNGDAEAFFQKMMFCLVRAKVELYDEPFTLRCFHGERASRFDLQEVRVIINRGIAKRVARPGYFPLRQLDYANVSKSGLHQLNDVLLGCVAYHWNRKMRLVEGSEKATVARYAQCECLPHDLGQPTPQSKRHFNIWPVKLYDPEA
jgi:hypothetical protein